MAFIGSTALLMNAWGGLSGYAGEGAVSDGLWSVLWVGGEGGRRWVSGKWMWVGGGLRKESWETIPIEWRWVNLRDIVGCLDMLNTVRGDKCSRWRGKKAMRAAREEVGKQ